MPTDRTGHPYFMYDEMLAQPDAARMALAADSEQRDHITKELASTHRATDSIVGPGFLWPSIVGQGSVWLTGCGTAHHAALTGAYWLRLLTRGIVNVRAAQAFEYAHDPLDRPRRHDALLALSHSGTPTATNAAAARAKDEGVYTVAVTAAPQSPLAALCDETLITTTAPTVAATYTISHVTMLAVLADLADRTASHLRETSETAGEARAAIEGIPDLIAAALTLEEHIRAVADALGSVNQVIFAGAGANWHTALEGALKTREAAYLSATGLQMEEVLHGPFASFDRQTALVLIAPPGAGRDRARDILIAVKPIGLVTIALTGADDNAIASLADHALPLPACEEWISAIPATVVAQQLAYWLSMARGANPDRIRRDQQPWLEARQLYTR